MRFPGWGIFHYALAFVCALLMGGFYTRRYIHPIPGRKPLLSLINAFISVILIINQSTTCFTDDSNTNSPIPCWISSLAYSWVLPMMVISVVIRSWMLLGQFEVTAYVKRVNEANRSQTHDGATARPAAAAAAAAAATTTATVAIATTAGTTAAAATVTPLAPPASSPLHPLALPWFVRHRAWLRPLGLFKITMTFIMALLTIYVIIICVTMPSRMFHACIADDPNAGTLTTILTIIAPTYLIASVIAIIIIARRLSRHKGQDAFGIGSELRWIGYGYGIVIVGSVIDIAIRPGQFVSLSLITCSALAVFIPTIVVPIHQSYRWQKLQRQQAGDLQRVKKVEELLALPQGYELFLQYCQTEFCSEALLYWSRLKSFRALCNQPHPSGDDYQKIINDAYSIMDTFILEGSQCEINISHDLRHTISVALQQQSSVISTLTTSPLPPPPRAISTSPNPQGMMHPNHNTTGGNVNSGTPKSAFSLTIAAATPPQSSSRVISPELPIPTQTQPQPPHPSENKILHSRPSRVAVAPSVISPLATFATIFDEACTVCLGLLQSGAFQRFTTSTIFKTFAAGLHQGQSSKQAMEHAVQSMMQPSASMDDDISSFQLPSHAVPRHGNNNGESRATPPHLMRKLQPVGAHGASDHHTGENKGMMGSVAATAGSPPPGRLSPMASIGGSIGVDGYSTTLGVRTGTGTPNASSRYAMLSSQHSLTGLSTASTSAVFSSLITTTAAIATLGAAGAAAATGGTGAHIRATTYSVAGGVNQSTTNDMTPTTPFIGGSGIGDEPTTTGDSGHGHGGAIDDESENAILLPGSLAGDTNE